MFKEKKNGSGYFTIHQAGALAAVRDDVTKTKPYNLSSADNSGAMITFVLLTGENYNDWASEMLNALRAKKKICFVDWTLPKPAADSPDLESWISVNVMVIGWLQTSTTPRVRSTISFLTDAHDLWTNLKDGFCVANKVGLALFVKILTQWIVLGFMHFS